MTEVIDFFIEQGPTVAYIILFMGSLVEGESIVLTAGYLAYKGYLDFYAIIAISFTATLIADQSLYFVGRIHGKSLLKRFPSWQPRFERAFALLHRYNTSFIFSFRFIYGIRTISPIMIGASGISIRRFAILNLLAAIVWSVSSCSAGYAIGYFFADEIEYAFQTIIRSQKYLLLALVSLSIMGYGYYKYKAYRAEHDNEQK